jgi:hypothetical protein
MNMRSVLSVRTTPVINNTSSTYRVKITGVKQIPICLTTAGLSQGVNPHSEMHGDRIPIRHPLPLPSLLILNKAPELTLQMILNE